MKKDQIENALDYARKGFYVFPAFWNKKTKQHIGLCKWATESSNDPNVIKTWGSLHPDTAYFCVALRQSGLAVIDMDVKDERGGLDTVDDLILFHGDLPDTLLSETPSGGLHYIYAGFAKIGADRLGPGVDIPVMVPLPGSNVPGKGQYKLLSDHPVAELPIWVTELAGQVPDKPTIDPQDPLIDIDQEHNIALAAAYLHNEAPPAPVGRRDDTVFKVAARIRQDFAVSQSKCLWLMIEHYLYKCDGDWSEQDMERAITSAYKYAQSPPGKDTAAIEFEPVNPGKGKIKFKSYDSLTQRLDPPNWLIKNYLEKDTVALLYGDSGAYKSFLALDIGLHVAANKDWLGQKTNKGTVIYLAGEGHGGIKRRLRAWKDHKGDDQKLPFYVSPHAIHLDKKDNILDLIQSIQDVDPEPALLIIDTLATAFGIGDENSTKDMNRFLNYVAQLRKQLECSIVIIHHTGHLAKERPRGAYALMAGVDAFYNVDRPEKGLTCLRAAGKMKDGMPQRDTWFKTVSVELGVDEDLDTITSLIMEHLPEYREPVKTTKTGLGSGQMAIVDLVRDQGGSLSRKKLYELIKEEKGEEYNRQSVVNSVSRLIARGSLAEVKGLLTLNE